jgi:hypothetical protein
MIIVWGRARVKEYIKVTLAIFASNHLVSEHMMGRNTTWEGVFKALPSPLVLYTLWAAIPSLPCPLSLRKPPTDCFEKL